MKKSELRNIIRKSIKEMMEEKPLNEKENIAEQDGDDNTDHSDEFTHNNEDTRPCDPQLWDNSTQWHDNFMNMPHFQSTNPNQPCNMICKKLSNWRRTRSNHPDNTRWVNQLTCKIEIGDRMNNIHDCTCEDQ